MDISTETLQAFLDDAWDVAPASASTLRNQLRAFEKATTSQFSTVGSIGSVSKNSTSQSYRGPGVGSYTLVQISNAWRQLINLYDEIRKLSDYLQSISNPRFVATFPIYLTDPDVVVYEIMKERLIVVDDYQVDLTNLRLRQFAHFPALA